ncbi:hypothetical protein NPIL_596631 [Nephila pilipes]|uniref:Mediator of RNA polymerase II transcription subunit 8 n=1 Tax=Nephila pilipes TaxID=299642 RepID=A0A8X6JEH6_NEPPI|nr:hypothetical protein NPIL_596631 [Nephila pilipes]
MQKIKYGRFRCSPIGVLQFVELFCALAPKGIDFEEAGLESNFSSVDSTFKIKMSVPMDKEEKALEMVIDALINRCQDLKNIISSFIMKLENESLNW